MVVRYIGARHHDARQRARTDLADGCRARAADDQICRCHAGWHVEYVLAHVDRRVLFQIDTEVFDILRHPAPAERARRMQMLKRFACLLLASHKFCDHFVHFPRTEASPARDDERTLVKPQLLARRLPAGV